MEAPTLRTSDVAAAVVGIVVGSIVLGIVYLVRPTPPPAHPSPPATPAAKPASSATATGSAAAKTKVCSTFHQADAAIGDAINGPAADPGAANARVGAAVVNSALALTRAVDQVTPPDIARPANELADAYSAYAIRAYVDVKPDPSAVVAATAAMRQVCA
jgi:hypothetical protein